MKTTIQGRPAEVLTIGENEKQEIIKVEGWKIETDILFGKRVEAAIHLHSGNFIVVSKGEIKYIKWT